MVASLEQHRPDPLSASGTHRLMTTTATSSRHGRLGVGGREGRDPRQYNPVWHYARHRNIAWKRISRAGEGQYFADPRAGDGGRRRHHHAVRRRALPTREQRGGDYTPFGGGMGGMGGAAFRTSRLEAQKRIEGTVARGARWRLRPPEHYNKAINAAACDDSDPDLLRHREWDDQARRPEDHGASRRTPEAPGRGEPQKGRRGQDRGARQKIRLQILEVSKKRDAFIQEEHKKQSAKNLAGFDEGSRRGPSRHNRSQGAQTLRCGRLGVGRNGLASVSSFSNGTLAGIVYIVSRHEKTCSTTRPVTHARGSAMRVLSAAFHDRYHTTGELSVSWYQNDRKRNEKSHPVTSGFLRFGVVNHVAQTAARRPSVRTEGRADSGPSRQRRAKEEGSGTEYWPRQLTFHS